MLAVLASALAALSAYYAAFTTPPQPSGTYALCARAPPSLLARLLPLSPSEGGTIYTADPARPTAECALVSDGRFLAVGDAADVARAWPGGRKGRTFYVPAGGAVTPGLADAHAHTLQWGFKENLPLAGSASITELVGKLEAYVRAHPELGRDGWIRGMGWDQTRFAEGRWPTADDLEASPLLKGRKIALQRVDVHATLVSRAVLSMLPSPLPLSDEEIERRGGKVLRGADGALSGVFIDTAEALLPLPPPTTEEKRAWFARTARDALSVGLVGIHDAWVGKEDVEFYMQLADEGALPIRMYLMGTLPPDAQLPPSPSPPSSPTNSTLPWPYLPRLSSYGPQARLTLRAIKLFADGALGSFGAALLAPYTDDPSTSGLMRTSEEVLTRQIESLAQDGWQVCTHAIGDRANRAVLSAYERVLAKPGMSARAWRPRIEHAQILAPADLARAGRLGVIPSVQPTHATSDMGYAEARLGPERIKGAYAYRTLLEGARASGAVMPLGSDFPVEGIAPLLGFYAAVARLDANGSSPHGAGGWYPEQKLARADALAGMTSAAAYAAFGEADHGAIKEGMAADWVLWDRDFMRVPETEILGTRVRATVVGGEVAYGGL